MAKVALFLIAFCLGIAFWYWLTVKVSEADHNVYLPYAGQTWIAGVVKNTQGYTYCLDSRAESYPSFRSQLADVVAEYERTTGIKAREVAFDASCQVQHVMLPAFPCGAGAAACVYYGNSPVVIHYREELGYTDWRSAHGHELGHAVLGQLHERYIDSGGSIGCGGPERGLTVMDCGAPFVKYPQPLDVERGCAIIATAWCGAQQPPPPPDCSGPTVDWGGGVTATWDPCAGVWRASNGYTYSPSNGWWGFRDVGFAPCDAQGLRQIPVLNATMPGQHSVFPWALGYWVTVPGCV